jgi:hypothetical protein
MTSANLPYVMTARTQVIQIRVTPDEKKQIERRAKKQKASVSELIRAALTEQQEATVAVPAEEPSAAVKAEPVQVDDLASRREARARELARTMPLVNARQLAARQIPE